MGAEGQKSSIENQKVIVPEIILLWCYPWSLKFCVCFDVFNLFDWFVLCCLPFCWTTCQQKQKQLTAIMFCFRLYLEIFVVFCFICGIKFITFISYISMLINNFNPLSTILEVDDERELNAPKDGRKSLEDHTGCFLKPFLRKKFHKKQKLL